MYKHCAGDLVESETSMVLVLLEVTVYYEETQTKQIKREIHIGLQNERVIIQAMHNFAWGTLPH